MRERWQTIAPPPQSQQPPRESHTAWVLVLAFLVSMVGAGTMHLVLGALQGEKAPPAPAERARVQVPDLVGLPVAGARLQVEGAHLLLHLVGPAPEGPTDSARILWQRPLAGSLVRVDDAIEVGFRAQAPSADTAPVVIVREVPDEDAPAAADEAEADAPTRAEPTADAPPTAAEPATAEPAADEAEETEMVVVPRLGRLDEDEARRRLEAVGLHGRFDSRFSPSVPSGRVILSRPGAGESVPRGGRVMVFVAE